jgi:hypothetical protein
VAFGVEEYDGDLAVAGLAWLVQDDQAARSGMRCLHLSHINIDLGIRGRAIGLLARPLCGDLATPVQQSADDSR